VEELVRAGESHSPLREHVVAAARNGRFSQKEIRRARALADRNRAKVARAMTRANHHGKVTSAEIDRIVSIGTP